MSKSSKALKGTSGSIASVIWLNDRRPLGTRVHSKQFGSAEILAFPLKRLDHRRPCRGRNASPLLPLLDGGAISADLGSHFRDRFPRRKNVVERVHDGEYASDELSAQDPSMIPMTLGTAERTIRPTMGRSSTPQRFRVEMAKRLESARRVAGYATKKQAADRLGIGLDRYEKWESGRTPVPVQYIGQVCELYGVDANFLIGTAPMRPQKETG